MTFMVTRYAGGRTFRLQSLTITTFEHGKRLECECQVLQGKDELGGPRTIMMMCEPHAPLAQKAAEGGEEVEEMMKALEGAIT